MSQRISDVLSANRKVNDITVIIPAPYAHFIARAFANNDLQAGVDDGYGGDSFDELRTELKPALDDVSVSCEVGLINAMRAATIVDAVHEDNDARDLAAFSSAVLNDCARGFDPNEYFGRLFDEMFGTDLDYESPIITDFFSKESAAILLKSDNKELREYGVKIIATLDNEPTPAPATHWSNRY